MTETVKEYSYDPEIFYNIREHEWCEIRDEKYVIIFLKDGTELTYGPYKNYVRAKVVYENIIDDNVNTKSPFLKEPLKAENVNIDGAVNLMSELLKGSREEYMAYVKALKKAHIQAPTSVKEYDETDVAKFIKEEIQRTEGSIARVDRKIEELISEPMYDKDELEKLEKRKGQLEAHNRRLYSQQDQRKFIKFMDDGCFGALGLLHTGISGHEIMKEWKKEALGYAK